jgi:SAM-dependent methyltransferase
VLEIGCGTGQATVSLARRGCSVVAVDLGTRLAEAAQRNLAPYPNARVVVDTFEDWLLPEEPFDVVVAFSSFHWVDVDVGVAKVAAALRTGGSFATIDTDHVAGGTDPFFVDVQECYERWDPTTPPGLRLSRAVVYAVDADPAGSFGPAQLRRYETDIAYATAAYLDVLQTYSPTRALDDVARAGLLACIGSLIDERYGGLVVKRYLRTMRVWRRMP